jgi:hypothetical protein
MIKGLKTDITAIIPFLIESMTSFIWDAHKEVLVAQCGTTLIEAIIERTSVSVSVEHEFTRKSVAS